LAGFLGVPFRFRKRLTKDRHDLLRRASGLRQAATTGLAQAMRLTIERQTCGSSAPRGTHQAQPFRRRADF
jgi:hypothetical protein